MVENAEKLKSQLKKELKELRQRISVLEIEETERKRVKNALSESEKRYRSLFEGVPIGLYRTTPEAQILEVNPALVKMLGYPDKESLIAVNVIDLYANPEDRKREQVILEQEMVVHSFEMQLHRLDGSLFWGKDTVRAVKSEDGQVLCYEGSLEDITERVQAEGARFEHSERLEEMVEERTRELHEAQEKLIRREKLAMLGQLAGGVGHEIRNPLAVISNAVYCIKAVLPDSEETIEEYLEIISSEVRNSQTILEDLLDISRPRHAEREEISVSQLIDQLLARQPPPDHINLSTQIGSKLPMVIVDSQMVTQVLVNLVRNAYQAMPQSGELTIEATVIKEGVRVAIIDTGCGITQENMSKLFEPLFTTKPRGIGLGLATSKQLIEATGGRIEVESKQGQGSTFTVVLPVKSMT